jgi:formylglycine-generating enzyme required for sulfatase activity
MGSIAAIPFDWVPVEKGLFPMGTMIARAGNFTGSEPQDLRLIESIRREVFIATFEISRFPVTNHQFLCFAEATGNSSGSFMQGFTPYTLDHPVRFITLYEALAFCNWASCRLPTEAEWEKAAAGTQGFRYPWGNKWNKLSCNNADYWASLSGSTAPQFCTTPVTQFSQGASPYGVMDMVGNAWELTSNTVVTTESDDIEWAASIWDHGDKKLETALTKRIEWPVLRGGAAVSTKFETRCAFKYAGYKAHEAGEFVGFRCVRLV